MPSRIYCSEESGHEPMPGTADRVDAWLLLEYHPAWKARAIDDGDLSADTRRWLEYSIGQAAADGLKVRPQLIRQPEIDRNHITLFVGLRDRLLCFQGDDYRFLQALDLSAVLADPQCYEGIAEPHYFVCTNGQRDVCCARFGLPVYAGLRARVGERVWQVTHLGGHRFAPNVLVLPQGVLYGRVAEDTLAGFLESVESGALAFDQMRGRTWLEPEAQAAEVLSQRSDLVHVATEVTDGVSTVRFAVAPEHGAEVTVRVRRSSEALTVRKSCGDAAVSEVRPFVPG